MPSKAESSCIPASYETVPAHSLKKFIIIIIFFKSTEKNKLNGKNMETVDMFSSKNTLPYKGGITNN